VTKNYVDSIPHIGYRWFVEEETSMEPFEGIAELFQPSPETAALYRALEESLEQERREEEDEQ
jgi:hypothetical protein